MPAHRRSPRLVLAALTGLATMFSVIALVAPAEAAIKAPTGLSPSGPVASSTPTFTWKRVTGATSYQFQADDSSSFSNPLVSTTTSNNKVVPTTNLPDGSIYWEVRAISKTGVQSSWASATANVSATAAPAPQSPIGGQTLPQPEAPPLLTWGAVNGAIGYDVQIDSTGTWVSPQNYSTAGTTYFVNTPQAPGTWFWRVRANRGNGLYTAWSAGAEYIVGPLHDVQSGADMNTGNPVQDVSIDWVPVPGAEEYQLQVGRDPDFNNLVDDRIVYGTRFQPSTTYDNDQYYWRVRAIDAGGNRMPWTTNAPFTFQRNWPQKPTLRYPANQLTPPVGDPMYYQWTPVRHASRYQLDVSTDPNFTNFASCFTTGTTFPVNNTSCAPGGQGVTTYWRVRGLDDPRSVQGIYSNINQYIYNSGQVTQASPANGATVDTPTLRWNAVRESQTYEVILRDKTGGVVNDITTFSTSWTPEVRLDPTKSPYSWSVQSIDVFGSESPLYPSRTFNVSGNDPTSLSPALTPLTGTSTDPATGDFPTLSWAPKSGAAYYRVFIGVAGSGFYDNAATSHINGATYAYPAATDTGSHYLAAGSYNWQVVAYDSNNAQVGGFGPSAIFTIKNLAATSGQQIALDGNANQNGQSCNAALANQQLCIGVPATPVLAWSPVPGAADYIVYLANDQELTNLVTAPVTVNSTQWRPPSDLPDNTAQDSYYWYVRPCKATGVCNPDPISTSAAATNAFRKQSPAVQLQSPGDGASLSGQLQFSWADYYDTNQGVGYASGADPSYQTARTYRIQVSQSPNFSNPVDDREVDQPFYAPSDVTYQQGLLYWRVQVVDPTGNHLTFSPVRSFTNDQAPVNLVPISGSSVPSPVANTTVGGAPPFRWAPVNGAAAYVIEVYRNDDSTHSPANLAISATTREPTYVHNAYLPPSPSAYRWRVRWTDAANQPRQWSADGRFFVSSSVVTLKTPSANTYQPYNGLYFSWNPVPLAATYRVDVRTGSGANAYQVTTAATANAPSTLGDGSYQWRVTALDPNNGSVAASTWRSFRIDGTRPTLLSHSPDPTGTKKSVIKVKFSEKVKGVSTKSIKLYVKGRTSRLPAKVKLSSNHTSVKVIPKAHLKSGKTYTVKLTKAIRDGAGNRLAPFKWKFTV